MLVRPLAPAPHYAVRMLCLDRRGPMLIEFGNVAEPVPMGEEIAPAPTDLFRVCLFAPAHP